MMTTQDQETITSSGFRNKLAMMVRDTQWSYAIFWTVSSTKAGVLEWGEGYYNGETRTEKTSKSQEEHDYNWGLQRSEQLRKLYKSLSEGKAEQGKKRNSSTLSMEDLSNMEWYYLVCMSFTFQFGLSLPGRAYATGEHIWLCRAQSADSKMFTRSLLAKSATVQTVLCFPHLNGVIELGSSDLISEDLKLIENIVNKPRELTQPICSERSSSATHSAGYDKNSRDATGNENDDEIRKLTLASDYLAGGEVMLEEEIQYVVNRRTSEDLTINSPENCSFILDSHDSLRQLLEDELFAEPFDSREITENLNYSTALPVTLTSMDRRNEHPIDNAPFYGWDDEQENEQFMILRSMVPSVTKTDEKSTLSIESTNEAEVRLNDLEFGMDFDMLEHTFESYKTDLSYTNPSMNKRKASEMNESHTDGNKLTQTDVLQMLDIEVNLVEDEVLVEMKCPWRENLLLDIIKVLSNLNLDTHAVQSSTFGGSLFLSLKSKLREAGFVTEAIIKQALRNAISMC